MDTGKIKAVIAAAVIIMISLAFYIPNVSAMDTAAREFETACKKDNSNVTAARYSLLDANGNQVGTGALNTSAAAGAACTATATDVTNAVALKLDNGEQKTLATAGEVATTDAPAGYKVRTVAPILNQFGTINRLVLGILPLLLILASFAYGALLVTGTGESISKSVKGEIAGLVLLQITTAFLPSILQFLVTASGATGGQYGVTNDFGGIINIVFGVIPIVMVVALIALIGQRIYREASSRGMVGAMA